MKESNFIFLFLLSVLFLNGCYYQSKVPLSQKPSFEMDMRLIGNWVSIDAEKKTVNEEETYFLSIRKFNKKEYALIMRIGGDAESFIARCFRTKINDINIINFQFIDFGRYANRHTRCLPAAKYAGVLKDVEIRYNRYKFISQI